MMNSSKHSAGRWVAFNIAIWSLAKLLFVVIKLWGLNDNNIESPHPGWPIVLVAIGLSGCIDGWILGQLDLLLDKWLRNAGILRQLMVKCLLNLLVGLGVSFVVIPSLLRLLDANQIQMKDQVLHPSQLIIIATYFILLTLLVQFIKLTTAWMKTHHILELLANPHGVRENRIFLFLDMKSSTSLGEQLEVAQYSRMIQECFRDLSEAARNTGGEIYQFVGDEVVMTWPESPQNFVQAVVFYFRFRKALETRKSWYLNQIGVFPDFKAGIHHGSVMKAQVGLMHKEIAYHGDPINTASRIQSMCNVLGRDLLISESVRDQLTGIFPCEHEGFVELRGKATQMQLYSIGSSTELLSKETKVGVLKRMLETSRRFVADTSEGNILFIRKMAETLISRG